MDAFVKERLGPTVARAIQAETRPLRKQIEQVAAGSGTLVDA